LTIGSRVRALRDGKLFQKGDEGIIVGITTHMPLGVVDFRVSFVNANKEHIKTIPGTDLEAVT